MDLKKGDRVLVNLAPFVGLVWRSKESIPCRVMDATPTHVEVVTEYPYREVSLQVQPKWIDGCLEGGFGFPQGHGGDPAAGSIDDQANTSEALLSPR